MNKARRKQIEEVLSTLRDASEVLWGLRDEEQEAYDSMPEGLQSSEKGERAQESADALDEACTHVDDAIVACESAAE